MKFVKTLIIFLLGFFLGLFGWWACPKEHTLSCSRYYIGHYRGFDLPGGEGPIWGKRYYLITVAFPNGCYLETKYKHPGYNYFKRFYPGDALAEEGQCLVEPYSCPAEPVPDDHNLLWSKCYKPDSSLCSEIKNGTGTQMLWTPEGVKVWELKLEDFKRRGLSMWHSNGQLHTTYSYIDGQKDGAFVSYYPSGAKMTEGAYSKGERAGKWTIYNEDSGISKIEDYTLSP